MGLKLNKNIPLMYAIVFLQGLVFYASVSTVYRQAKGLSLSEIFIIESVTWLLMILLEIPWGLFADRFGYKKTIVIANFIFLLSKVVFFAAASFPVFLLERVLLTLALSGLSGCDIALLHHSMTTDDHSERVFARYRWFEAGGLLIASLVSPLLISISLEATALATIVPYAAAVVLSLMLTEVSIENRAVPNIKESLLSVVRNRRILLLVFGAALGTEAVQSVTVFLNQPQYVRSGIDIRYFGFLLALTQAVRLISVKSHVLSGRFGKGRAIGFLSLVIPLSCAGLAFTASPVISIVLICFIAAAMALADPMLTDLKNSAVATGDRATVLSGYSMCGSLIAAAVNPMIGFGADASIQSGFLVCAAIGAAGFVLILLSKLK